MAETIALFDFDGTITTADTFGLFARFAVGRPRLIRAAICSLPAILSWKLGFRTGGYAKEQLFGRLYSGLSLESFMHIGENFAGIINRNLNADTMALLHKHRQEGHKLYIVTASIGQWVRPWAKTIGAEVIATEPQVDADGKLSGRFSTPNCTGKEKVRRFLEKEPDRTTYTLYAYGDSDGDTEMLALADFPFRIRE